MPKLVTWMNNQRVGELTKLANGAHTFKNRARQRWCRDVNTRRRNRNASDNGMGKAY